MCNRYRRLGALLLTLSLAFAFAGCATSAKKSSDNDEYEYITVTGSNLRVKVKKGTRTPVDDKVSVPSATLEGSDVHDAFEAPKTVGDLPSG